MLSWDMNINNFAVTILLEWHGEEVDWNSVEVIALMPTPEPSKAKYWVTVNDLLSDADWDKISDALYWNEKEIKMQGAKYDY